LSRYVAPKGSIAADGVSPTVNSVRGNTFEVNVIPHTQAVTVIGGYRRGVAVNFHVAIIARYLERLGTAGARSGRNAGVDMERLQEHGYARKDLLDVGALTRKFCYFPMQKLETNAK
jgi:riboflavin synthase